MKRLTDVGDKTFEWVSFDRLKIPNLPRIPFSAKWFWRIIIALGVLLLTLIILGYFLVFRPVMAIAASAKKLEHSMVTVNNGLREFNFTEVQEGLEVTKRNLQNFEGVYEENTKTLRKIPFFDPYYQDGQHLIEVAGQSLELGDLVVEILKPHASDLGFATNGISARRMPAQDRVVKLLGLMPQFSPKVSEISMRMQNIDKELTAIDASRYPTSLPFFVKYFGVNKDINIREQILALQSVSNDVATKAPQFESLFDAIPEFMGLNEPKRYLILMANNYEARMSGGFNTYIVAAEFDKGIPQITYSIDTYFIDEGDRTGSSFLVNRNVPYFLRNYLYLSGNTYRLYARDATSSSPDFPTAVDTLLREFWRRDRSLPQEIDGVIQINNDMAVNLLKVVGPVNTEKFSIKTDAGNYITVPFTEFSSDNVITELENIAGGKLAQTMGRKEIIKFLGQSILEKIFTSEATNLVNIAKVMLDSMSRKDIMLYSFDPGVQKAFSDLGYGGRIKNEPLGWDYLHISRSNFGSGKADWTKDGFVTQTVKKNVEIKAGKKISAVEVTIHNPKRPSWYNIDPCCFYNAYMRIYVPMGSKMISIETSDGQDPNGAEYTDEDLHKTFLESFTRQQKETDLTITYTYELPDSVNLDDYNILIQRQSGTSTDPYTIAVNGISQEILLNSDTTLSFE